MTQGYENSAVENRGSGAQKSIGDPTSRYCHQVDGTGIGAVNSRGLRSIETEAADGRRGDHVQNQDGAHPVVAETLPHLSEEKRRQSTWMPTNPGRIHGSADFGCNGAVYRGHRWHKLATEPQTIPSDFSLFRCGPLAAIIASSNWSRSCAFSGRDWRNSVSGFASGNRKARDALTVE